MCKNDTVQVDDAKAGFPDSLLGQLQHFARIAASIRLVRIGKELADVTQGGGTEDRVRDGVQQHISVAVPNQVVVVWHADPANHQRPAKGQSMRIVTKSNS